MGGESSKSKPLNKGNVIPFIKKGTNLGRNCDIETYLATSQKTRVLNIKSLKLKQLPEKIIEVKDLLKHLDASQNLITTIPSFIGTFINLKQLILNSNVINSIPEEIGLCQNLTKLELSGNKLTNLPDNLKCLEKLTTILLSKNLFTSFPKVLCDMINLEVVDLSENNIIELPEEIEKINCLELNLSFNNLQKLNDNLGKCKKLKVLRVNNNNLTIDCFPKSILEESKIAKIDFENNNFTEKNFQSLPGYGAYEQRYTANRMKL
uniref:Leucine-rich repeat-containing protein 57 (inferred by orthology to a human protein) n=1 Tax=Strongyloides venezuelensis TaxID=75913 RepID=A0A0K0FBP2_STRVS